MNNFLAGISMTLSCIAVAVSGWTLYQSSQLQATIDLQQDSITKQKDENARLEQKIVGLAEKAKEVEEAEAEKVTAISETTTSSSVSQNTQIEPGEFVRQGFDNQIKIELLSVKRIKNPDSEERDVVVVKTRIRRLVSDGTAKSLSFYAAKGRNPETSEVYRAIFGKTSNAIPVRQVPQDSWGNAFFWLKVPEQVNTIDIVLPSTAIFENVPVSS